MAFTHLINENSFFLYEQVRKFAIFFHVRSTKFKIFFFPMANWQNSQHWNFQRNWYLWFPWPTTYAPLSLSNSVEYSSKERCVLCTPTYYAHHIFHKHLIEQWWANCGSWPQMESREKCLWIAKFSAMHLIVNWKKN